MICWYSGYHLSGPDLASLNSAYIWVAFRTHSLPLILFPPLPNPRDVFLKEGTKIDKDPNYDALKEIYAIVKKCWQACSIYKVLGASLLTETENISFTFFISSTKLRIAFHRVIFLGYICQTIGPAEFQKLSKLPLNSPWNDFILSHRLSLCICQWEIHLE